MTSSTSVSSCRSYYCAADTTMTDSCSNNSSSIKISEFPLLAKNQRPTKEIIYFAKNFSLFANYSFNQIPFSYIWPCIKRTKPQHHNTPITLTPLPISPTLIILKFHHVAAICTFPYFSISLTKFLFLNDNTITTHHYPSYSYSLILTILKFHSLCCL